MGTLWGQMGTLSDTPTAPSKAPPPDITAPWDSAYEGTTKTGSWVGVTMPGVGGDTPG